jgi:hypothetical protein
LQSTGIAQEIAALREQIATARAAIKRQRSRVLALREAGQPWSRDDAELGEMIVALDFMVARLSRLESCNRTPEK